MSEVKPCASLSSGLLARKGQAKPAMRPQGFGTFGAQSTGFDDLGWNDMGHDRAAAPQIGLTPMETDGAQLSSPADTAAAESVDHAVFQQRQEIERSFATTPVEAAAPILATKRKAVPTPPAEVEPGPVVSDEPVAVAPPVVPRARTISTAPVARTAPGGKPRSAFTLRLDQERHLQLRLASAVAHRSSQQLVIEALDAFLANNPSVAGISLPAAK